MWAQAFPLLQTWENSAWSPLGNGLDFAKHIAHPQNGTQTQVLFLSFTLHMFIKCSLSRKLCRPSVRLLRSQPSRQGLLPESGGFVSGFSSWMGTAGLFPMSSFTSSLRDWSKMPKLSHHAAGVQPSAFPLAGSVLHRAGPRGQAPSPGCPGGLAVRWSRRSAVRSAIRISQGDLPRRCRVLAGVGRSSSFCWVSFPAGASPERRQGSTVIWGNPRMKFPAQSHWGKRGWTVTS